MKRLLLLLLVLPSCLLAIAQGYHRTLVPGRYWDVLYCFTNYNPLPCQVGVRWFLKDTTVMINDHEYHPMFQYKIMSANDDVFYEPFYVDNTQEFTNHVWERWMREDTVSGKLYALDINEDEYLVTDYSINEGDIYYNPHGQEFPVDEVVDATLLNGDIRRVIVLSNGTYFIEGLGYSKGIAEYPEDVMGGYTRTRCVMDGTEILWNFDFLGYWNPDLVVNTSTCIGTLSVNDLPALPSIAVFPNPAMDRITIERPPVLGVSATLEVFSITGQRMFRQEEVPTTLHMDISGWPRGAYMYEVTHRDGQKSRGTLLAQ